MIESLVTGWVPVCSANGVQALKEMLYNAIRADLRASKHVQASDSLDGVTRFLARAMVRSHGACSVLPLCAARSLCALARGC